MSAAKAQVKSLGALQGADRVAAVLMAMGKPAAARLMKHFDADEIKVITRSVADLRPGMVLEEDLYRNDGTFLLRHGNAITAPLKVRLDLMAHDGQIPPTLRVLVPRSSER